MIDEKRLTEADPVNQSELHSHPPRQNTVARRDVRFQLERRSVEPISFQDIAVKKALPSQLPQSDERFRLAIENMLDSFAICSAVRDGSGRIVDFLVEYVNERVCRDLKMDQGQLIGSLVLDLFPVAKSVVFEKCCRVVETGAPLNKDSVLCDNLSGDGLAKVYDFRVIRMGDGLAAMWRDVTERSQAEIALRTLEERFSKAFYANLVAQAIVAYEDGRFLDVNASFERLTGYSRADAIGCTISDLKIFVNPEQRQQMCYGLKQQGEFRDIKHEFPTKSGEIKVGLGSGILTPVDGQPCLLVSIIDITEKKQMEKEIARLERLNLTGEIAAGIAHEIRNPMTAVRGFLQLLQMNDECAPRKRYYDIMIKELDQANAIITEFLSLARNNPVELKLQNLDGILQALLSLIRINAINSGHCVAYQLRVVPDLYLDEKLIRQLVLHLVRNGLEAMPGPGTLTIKTFLDQDQIVLTVSDQGSGIEPRVLEKLGTPFLTTKERGTGLGLAVCYRIAERHNANLEVETGSSGTTFKVVFQVNQELAAQFG